MADAGLSLSRPQRVPLQPAELAQRQQKAELIAASWAAAGIDAVALGSGDWMLGGAFVRQLAETHELPVLAANLTCDGAAPFPASAVIERGGHRIGFVGVTSGEVEGCEVTDAGAAIREAVSALEPVELVVGLLPTENDRELGEWTRGGLPLDVALDARGRHAGTVPEARGSTWVFGAGSRGKHLGVLRLEWVDGGEGWAPEGQADALEKRISTARNRLTAVRGRIPQATDEAARKRLEAQVVAYEKQIADTEAQIANLGKGGTNRLTVHEVALSAEIADHPETAARVAGAKTAITSAAGSVDPRRFVPRVVEQGPYAGGEACVACHTDEHAQWSRTGHARAWNALVAEDRAFDDDCWSCHVTGAGAEGGPPTAAASGPWRDVQCEACHGPSRDHVESPATATPVRDPGVEGCTGCHDGEQDMGRFDYSSYRPKVVHGDGS